MANYELQGESEYMNWLTVSYNEDDDEDSYFEGWLSVVKRLNDSSNYSEAKITINTAKQPFWGKITNVTLTLNISEYSTGRFRIAGKVFDATIGNKSVDITEQYLAASGELNLWITGIPTTSADASIKFDTSGKNAPKLTFEYLKPHNYKSIELTDGVTAGLNFVEDKRVITITDCENTVGGMTVALSHVYNSNGGGGAPYGFCFNLNVCETYNGSTGVLVEANGDAYHRSGNLIKNYSVEGRATPVLIQKVPEATRLNNNNNINWLYADGVFKGYNVSDLKLAIICDITGNCILFKYNSDGSLYTVRYSKDGISTLLYEMQYSGGKLTHLIDKVRNDGILYTYSGTALSSIIKSGLTYSLTYGDDDDNVQLEDIKISNGYAIYSFPNSINVRSSVTKIPDGSATVGEKIASWDFERIANGTYQITDIDGNREQIKYAKDGYISEQLIEQNGVVVSAEQYSYKEQDYRNTYKASRSSLFKNKIENFRFTTGETTKTVLNGYNQPTKSTTTNITVTETSTANSVTDYTYNSNLQLIKEQTVVTYSTSGQSNVSYTYITEYDYSEDGKTVTKTSYVNGEQALNGKTIEKQVITDSAEGTRTVITKAYNSKAQTDIIYAEKKYNANGQQTSEYDGVDGRVSFTYNGKGEVGNVTYPNNSQVTYDYDAQSRVTTVSCADSFNGIMYLSGEVTAMNDGNSSIGLEYDGKRRISKAKVGGQEIESYTYSEGNEFNTDVKTVLLTYGNGTTVKSVAAKDGSFVKGYINGALKYTANYNKDGSVASETDSVTGEVTNYTYDESTGLLKKVETKKNGAVTQTAQYTYNRFGKLASGGNHTYIYEDNAEKRLYSDTLAGKGVTFYDYDLLGRVKYKSLLTLKGSTITNQTIAYKKNGEETNNRPAKITYEDGEDIKYEYDSNGRIHCVTKFGYDSDYYHYDSRGRLVREDNA